MALSASIVVSAGERKVAPDPCGTGSHERVEPVARSPGGRRRSDPTDVRRRVPRKAHIAGGSRPGRGRSGTGHPTTDRGPHDRSGDRHPRAGLWSGVSSASSGPREGDLGGVRTGRAHRVRHQPAVTRLLVGGRVAAEGRRVRRRRGWCGGRQACRVRGRRVGVLGNRGAAEGHALLVEAVERASCALRIQPAPPGCSLTRRRTCPGSASRSRRFGP